MRRSVCIQFVLTIILFLIYSRDLTSAVPLQSFYPFGEEDLKLVPNRYETISPEIVLSTPIKFYGETYSSIYVNANGLLSFLSPLPYFISTPFPLEYPVIAPLYSNVDLTYSGNVFYRETKESGLLAPASVDIQRYFSSSAYGFQATGIFIATWSKVGYYPAGYDKVNTFQVVVVSNETDSYIQFLYADDGIQWLQTFAEGKAKAQAGIMSANGRLYTLKGSGTDQIRNLNKWSNIDVPGLWMFHVGNIGSNVESPQYPSALQAIEVDGAIKTCFTGHTLCHSDAECRDLPTGFCCICKESSYGNGYNCLKKDAPLRANGRVNITVNGVSLSNLNLQVYISVSDGRTYWALSKVPMNLGPQFQFLHPLITVVGWLFAKQVNNGLNGYQITGGVLNYSALIGYSETGDQITVTERFLGLDIYDQLSIELNVKGTVPNLPKNGKLFIEDYQFQFISSNPGIFHSVSSILYKRDDDSSGRNHTISFQQTITYSESCSQQQNRSSPTTFRVKAARNFLEYESKENILRFATTNKVSVWSETDDPCIEGRVRCVVNSSCIAEDDTFKCVCNPGFRSINPTSEPVSGEGGCRDVNECVEGIYTCDPNALCVNEVGSYYCQCKPNYTGNGYYCSEIESSCAKNPEQCVGPHTYCTDPKDLSTCRCKEGFQEVYSEGKPAGSVCEDVDECRLSFCHKNATCTNFEGGYMCDCNPGFTGDGLQCTTLSDPCEKFKCDPGAECLRDQYGNARCQCSEGYTFDNGLCVTEKPIDIVTVTCDIARDCSQNAECIFNETTREYACRCIRGYYGDGYNCEIIQARPKTVPKTCVLKVCFCPSEFVEKDDVCVAIEYDQPVIPGTVSCNGSNICHQNAQCIFNETTGVHSCQCDSGYEGNGIECSDIALSCLNVKNCDSNATCQIDPETQIASCVCNHGFQGDGTSCVYVGTCTSNSDCRDNEECTYDERIEAYDCRCISNYVKDLDGNCVIKKECPKCHEHAECIESDTFAVDPYCRCTVGYTGDGTYRCSLIPPPCNVINNCSPFANCAYNASLGGFSCQCKRGYDGDGWYCFNSKTCAEVPELCHGNASCIVRSKISPPQCECNVGHFGNGTYCVEIPRQEGNFLLLNHELATLRIPLQPISTNPGYPIHIQSRQSAVGIAINCVDGKVFWSDYSNHVIKSSNYKGKDVHDVVNKNISSPEGLTVDWIHRVLYWTDSNKHTIESINLDGTERKVVISKDLVNPRGIAVHPYIRKIFWSDWNRAKPKIEWSNLDGSERSILVEQPKIKLPNSVSIDWSTNELCWADAEKKTIDCIGLDTQSFRTVVTNCTYPFGLTITNDRYYWTDWTTGKIGSADKQGNKLDVIPIPISSSGRLYGIVYVPPRCP